MNESEIIKLVKETVRQQLAPILMASVESNETSNRSTVSRFSSDSKISNLRNIQPYGISSRAPKGTDCLIIPVDGNASHLNMGGHFDKNKPQVSSDGEAILYGADGQVIYLKAGGTIHQGSKTANEPVVLGNVLKACISSIIDDFITPPILGYDSFGLPIYLDGVIVTNLTSDKATFVTNPLSNIVGKKNFVERG